MVFLRLHPTQTTVEVPPSDGCSTIGDLRLVFSRRTGMPGRRMAFFHSGVKLPDGCVVTTLPQGDQSLLHFVLLPDVCAIGQLPEELLRHVLEYAEAIPATAVSRQWHHIGRGCLRHVEPFPQRLSRRSIVTNDMVRRLLFPRLQTVDLAGCRQVDDDVLRDISSACRAGLPLRRLNLRSCMLLRNFQVLECPQLSWLNVSDCWQLTHAPSAIRLPALKHLLHSDSSVLVRSVRDALLAGGFAETQLMPVLHVRVRTF
eukprot:EG_transcript_25363